MFVYMYVWNIYIYMRIYTSEHFKFISKLTKKNCTSYPDTCFLPVTVFGFSKTINLNDHFLISSIHWLKQLKFGEKCEEATAAR